ncbi:MAG: hypothetical protein KF796_03700 [Ramlibacter sp.]|nr:hypothetical protein [Ramlibacter sp.]
MNRKPLLALVTALGMMASAAQAGPVEDAFGEFIARLKSAGQRINAVVPGLLGQRVAEPYVMNRVDNLPLARLSVVVFVSSNCPDCLAAVQDARAVTAVNVEVMDVSSSGLAREAFAMTHASGLPATMAGTQILVGRQPTMLASMLGAAGMGPPPPVPN